MNVNIQLKAGAEAPTRAHPGDAGFDLRAWAYPAHVVGVGGPCDYVIEPFERVLIPTGITLELPDGYCAMVLSRSGLAIKHGIAVANAPGLIDAGYRGEVGVILENRGPRSFAINHGDRIAQLVILELPSVQLVPVNELAASARGAAGFGSTGI